MQIKVNGSDHEWPDSTITYCDVVSLAYGPNTKRLMSITYYWRGGETSDTHREGIISPNSPPVKIAAGMFFNAYHTSNA